MQRKAIQGVRVLLLVLLFAPGLAAAGTFVDGLPEDWTCTGTCGTASANGVVTVAPSGASAYGWVTTTGSSFRQAVLPGIGGTNGSQLRSRAFSAQAGQKLAFDFNYVTSDGGGFADYAWARLLNAELEPVALLFTARTRSSGTIVPGFGMPDIEAQMTPETVQIIGGGPRWSPLGGDSGRCFSSGCGYTGWVRSIFSIPEAGDYVLEFGVVNWSDTRYQSGLAFDGVTVGGQPIDAQADYRDVQVVARLPAQGIELIPDSFATVPLRITPLEDYIEIEWFFEAFSLGQLEALDHQVTVLNPQPGERRVVVEEVLLRYRDLAGVEHQRRLGPFDLEVLASILALDLVLDRANYTVGETVLIDTQITNLGETAAIASVQLDVLDAAGYPVRSLAGFDALEVAAQAPLGLAQRPFDTAGLYAGTYQVHARVRETGADADVSAYASFQVGVPADTALSAAVLADQGFYDPLETVTLIGRLRNTAPNLQIDGHSARMQVLDPQGQEFWRVEATLATLGAGGERDWLRSLPLGNAAAGPYRVILTARDAQETVRAVAETSFQVRSTQDTGAGLAGSLLATPDPVLRSETLALSAEVVNRGNADLNALPVTLKLVDPAREQELASWSWTVDLVRDASCNLAVDWRVEVPEATILVAILQAEIQGQMRVLDHRTVRVADRFDVAVDVAGDGRVLVLLDPPEARECQGVQRLRLDLAFEPELIDGDHLELQLFDAEGRLLDAEAGSPDTSLPVDDSHGVGANLILRELAPGRAWVEVRAPEAERLPEPGYQLAATVHRGGISERHLSGPVPSACGVVAENGTNFGAFRLDETGIVADGLSTERRAFLEAQLRARGWSYTLVTDRHAFARELRRGGYSSFLLLSSHVRLDTQVARELREAIFAGRGIVLGAIHDHRNHHLLEVFGVHPVGAHPHVNGILPLGLPPFAVPDELFAVAEPPLALRLQGAVALAEYRGIGGRQSDRIGLVAHTFGRGTSVMAGFDLLNQAHAAGADTNYGRLLRDALEHVQPDVAFLRPGVTVPVRWQLFNRGGLVSLHLGLEVAGGAIVDPVPRLETDALSYALELPAGGHAEDRFWWRLPADPQAAWISVAIDLQEGAMLRWYDTTTQAFTPVPLPDFETLRQALGAHLGLHPGYATVEDAVTTAEAADQAGEPEQAVFHLLKAADGLAEIAMPEADALREIVAWLIHRIASTIP